MKCCHLKKLLYFRQLYFSRESAILICFELVHFENSCMKKIVPQLCCQQQKQASLDHSYWTKKPKYEFDLHSLNRHQDTHIFMSKLSWVSHSLRSLFLSLSLCLSLSISLSLFLVCFFFLSDTQRTQAHSNACLGTQFFFLNHTWQWFPHD